MRNADKWQESKYVLARGQVVATRDRRALSASSRLIATIVGRLYHRELARHAAGRLLDLGCGKAPLFGMYRGLVKTVTCVDWGQSIHRNDFIDCEADLTKPLPFPDGSFDTIILSDVLEHIPTPEVLCAEISRILTAGGKLLLNVPFYYPIHEEPFDFYRYTEFALNRLLTGAGMAILSLNAIGGAPEVLADILAKMIQTSGVRGGTAAAAIIQKVALSFIETSSGRRASAATASRFPLGYFAVATKGPT